VRTAKIEPAKIEAASSIAERVSVAGGEPINEPESTAVAELAELAEIAELAEVAEVAEVAGVVSIGDAC
jgi:hypothetical protein